MKISVADRNIIAKIYCRCLPTFFILDLALLASCGVKFCFEFFKTQKLC